MVSGKLSGKTYISIMVMIYNWAPNHLKSSYLFFTYTRFTNLGEINRCIGILSCVRDENNKDKSKKEFCIKHHKLSSSGIMTLFVILLTWLMMTGTDGRDLPLERETVIGKQS